MTCRDVSGMLPLFFDGELDSRQMRIVALHSTRCGECENELRHIERLQELVSMSIMTQVDAMDLNQVWPGVEARLRVTRASWVRRARLWWEEQELTWWLRVPALGTAAATAAVAATLWLGRADEVVQMAKVPAPLVDNSASIDSLYSNADEVAMLSEPETNTMVLWVNDDGGGEAMLP